MQEFVNFLGSQAPYDTLDADDLQRLAREVEAEYVAAGTMLVPDGAPRLDHMWVVRSGSLEVLDRGRVVDQLAPGDTVGHISVMSGLPPTLSVRAAEDTLCYRLPDPRGVLDHPERLAFAGYGALLVRERMTRQGGLGDKAHRPVREYTRPPAWCEPDTPIRQVARRMGEAGLSYALVRTPDGIGIVTDHDFRRRVGSGEVPVDAPVSAIVTVPVLTVPEETVVASAFLEMIEHGVHHLVVTDATGSACGVVRVVDLASAEVRDPLVVRAAVEAARSLPELAEACRLLRPTAVELYESGVPPTHVGALLTAVLDAVLRRLLHLQPPVDAGGAASWLVLGSLARREVLPSSDIDTAVVWDDKGRVVDVGPTVLERARRVLDAMERCGLARCTEGVNADNPRFSRSLAAWSKAARGWVSDLSEDGALLLATMLADSRPLTEVALGRSVADRMLASTMSPQFRHALMEYTLAVRPPTGFVRNFVVEHSGEHRGQLSLKRGGLRPVTSIGRWVAVVTGDNRGSTVERLRRGVDATLLTADEAESLVGAFDQVYGLLLEQEVNAIKAGVAASTYVNPAELDSLTRRHLRESFRAIAHVQSRLEVERALRLV